MRSEVLKGHVEVLLLSVLEDSPAHGYRILELVRERSEGALDLAEGTVYPALYRLEGGGALTSTWSTAEGRRRRVYRLTRHGRAELSRQRAEWTSFVAAVRAVIA